jgi:DNA-binding Xre family transcriptional regulator
MPAISRKPVAAAAKLSPARIRALHALAKQIDADEQPAIKSRARRAFAQHQTIRALISTLKSRRLEQHLTLADLAARTGIAKPNLSRLENNHRASPTLDTLQRYAQALGMKVHVTLN